MGFLSKNKTSAGLRTLSEKEIQAKLYGRYHPAALTALSEEPPDTRLSPADLFEKTEPPFSAAVEPPAVKSPRPARAGFSDAISPKKSERAFKAASKMAARSRDFLVAGVRRTSGRLLSLDFSEPAAQRRMAWAGGLALLTLIFIGIHALNNQREAAMKSPRARERAATGVPAPSVQEANPKSIPAASQPAAAAIPALPGAGETGTHSPLAAPMPDSAEEKPYTIQVATYAAEADAERLAQRF